MNVAPDDAPEGVIAYRLTALEGRLSTMEQNVERRLDVLQGTISNLAFVRRDVYDADQKSIAERFAVVDQKIRDGRRQLNFVLGVVLTSLLIVGALITVLRAIAK